MTSNPEDLFPPRPGGMVDTARKQQAAASAQLGQLGDQVTESTGYDAIRVRPDASDLGIARTITLGSSNKVVQLLPRDETRRSAIILAVDNDIWISTNQGTADDLAGTSGAGGAFYLPKGIAVPVVNQAQHWAACTTTVSTSRVSVLVSKDSTP